MCTSQIQSPTQDLEGDRVTSGWPPEPLVKTRTEHAVPSTRASPATEQDGSSKTKVLNHALFNGQICKSQPTPGGISLFAHVRHPWGPWLLRKPPPLPLPVCACVYSCACTRSYTLTRACARSPVLRKSKIAVSLNSFPLAARTAFVLQTKKEKKRDRGLRRGGEKEGEREPEAKEQTEEEGNRKGEREEGKTGKAQEEGGFLLYSDRRTDRGAGEGSPPLTHALCKNPGLPDVTTASKTQDKRLSSPPEPPREDCSRWA